MRIDEALNVSKRSVSYREAEVFLGHVIAKPREWLHTHPSDLLTAEQESFFERCLKRREDNEPVAYIIGCKEFYGRPFVCDSRALIPRPETEVLIDQALEILPKRFHDHLKTTNKPCPLRILELGTGCGNIAATLALELFARSIPTEILATDVSNEALALAKDNWIALALPGSREPQWLNADLFDAPLVRERAPYDLVIANLPYVPAAWQFDPIAQPDVVFYEPDISLFGGTDGLDIYRRFFLQVNEYLQCDGHVLIEYNEDQTADIINLIKECLPSARYAVQQDYAGLDRTVRIDMCCK